VLRCAILPFHARIRCKDAASASLLHFSPPVPTVNNALALRSADSATLPYLPLPLLPPCCLLPLAAREPYACEDHCCVIGVSQQCRNTFTALSQQCHNSVTTVSQLQYCKYPCLCAASARCRSRMPGAVSTSISRALSTPVLPGGEGIHELRKLWGEGRCRATRISKENEEGEREDRFLKEVKTFACGA
jgi:hypothetical protein